MNLKESKGRYIGELGWGKLCSYIIILKNERNIFKSKAQDMAWH